MTPIGDAQQLWNNPQELIKLWNTLESKEKAEKLISDLVGKVGVIADLGCGAGRFSKVLKFDKYYGYDSSSEMISYAYQTNNYPGIEFACLDILKFSSDLDYDVVICIDVLIHLHEPLKAAQFIFNNWRAKKYIFTLLVGNGETLYNSIVVSREEFNKFIKAFNIKSLYLEQVKGETFSWVVLEHNGY